MNKSRRATRCDSVLVAISFPFGFLESDITFWLKVVGIHNLSLLVYLSLFSLLHLSLVLNTGFNAFIVHSSSLYGELHKSFMEPHNT